MPKLPPNPMDQASLAPFLFEGDDKRSQILRAAMVLFFARWVFRNQHGCDHAEAGVSKATVYAHFKSKDVLFKEIIRKAPGSLLDFPPRNGVRVPSPRIFSGFLARSSKSSGIRGGTTGTAWSLPREENTPIWPKPSWNA